MPKSRKNLLTEVIVVSILLILLIGISILRFFKAQTSTELVQVLNDLKSLHQAFEAYYVDHKAYPPDFDSGQISGIRFMSSGESLTYKCLTAPTAYINEIPLDVFMTQPGAFRSKNPPHYEYAGPGTHLTATWAPSKTYWTAMSIGPDLMSQGSWNFDHDQAMKISYHSSNGLISLGDIYASNRGIINPLR